MMIPRGPLLYIRWTNMTQRTRIYMVKGWGSWPFSRYLGTSSLRGVKTTPKAHDLHCTYHLMPLDTRNKNIYGWGVVILTVFKLFVPVWRGSGKPPGQWPTYHVIPLNTWNKNIYGLGAGISNIFKIFGHFLLEGGQDHPKGPWPT